MYKRHGRETYFIIRDGAKRFSTHTADEAKANEVLKRYISCPKWFRHKQKNRRGRVNPLGLVWLYFIEMAAEDRPIKIGIANDVRARMWNLRVGSPFDMVLLASANVPIVIEAALHEKLAAHCIRGEWYRRSPDVDAAIEATRNGKLLEFIDGLQLAA